MKDQQLSDILLTLLTSVLLPKSSAYVAGPLTSGKQFYDQLAAGVQDPQVRPENERRLTLFVERLRENLDYPVFDPGVLKVPSWSDVDHGAFFIRVIETTAKEVWLVDGWEFSIGATKEFMHSCKLGIPCRDQDSKQIDRQKGVSMIRAAADYILELGLDASRLLSRIS